MTHPRSSSKIERHKAHPGVMQGGRMTHPPKTRWELNGGHKYCTFLSHYKVEAGADARYLSDLIHRMTGASAYLDSSDLVDLGTLFREGGACIWCHDELEELRISSYHATKSPLALWSLVSAQDLSPERS